MKQTERYLKQATRGLWGQQRQALRAELHGHIQERIAEFRLGGLSVEDAERQTLRELGVPAQVSTGMLGVHALPALGKAGALSALLATALLTMLPLGSAQVKGIYRGLYEAQGKFNSWPGAFLDFEQLRAAIEQAGGTLSGPAHDPTITIPGAPRSMPLNTAKSPGATFQQAQKTYVNTDLLLDALLNSGADLSVHGWTKPVLQAGATRIGIDTDDLRISSSLYQRSLLGSFNDPTIWSRGPVGFGSFVEQATPLRVTGNVQDNAVYALIVPKFAYWSSQRPDGTIADGFVLLDSNINQARGGQVQLQLPLEAQHYRLYARVSSFQSALEPSLSPTAPRQWDAQHPAPALLLKLSGKFGRDAFTVVDPKTIQLK
ncbi:permease prefix domain 1-containing protein [Deinococcus sonorensis]|uniref:Permease prefix domain 1-containing protein n=1 Tax=Deinococcus sonorensis TaxID=309891 RepID=A0ABV8Y9S1_9DEIO